jgi:hypothetical protein
MELKKLTINVKNQNTPLLKLLFLKNRRKKKRKDYFVKYLGNNMFNMYSLILCVLLLQIIFSPSSLFAEEPNYPKQSEYSSQIDECIQSEK